MSLQVRSSRRNVGPGVVVVLVVALAVLWWVDKPAGEATGSYVGQLIGAESILLMSIALVLISTLPWVDTYFDGIDRAAIWHRRAAILGIVLLLPHILMAHGGRGPQWAGPAGIIATVGLAVLIVWAILPRWRTVIPRAAHGTILAVHEWPPVQLVSRLVGNYEIWRQVHRTTGLFVAVGFVHGVADGTPWAQAPVLRWTYVAIGAVGLAFYVYRELLARRGHGLRDYQVSEVRNVGDGLTEIVLHPLGPALDYAPGQFAMLHLETKTGWHRHPFTLASSPSEPDVRVTIKALGDYTSEVATQVRSGMPAVLSGPHGRFSHHKGTARQVWIAGGVGVTPFLSWLRSLDEHPPPGTVDFFYAVADEVPYLDEIRTIAASHPDITLHVVRADIDGFLTTGQILDAVGHDVHGVSVFLCGPTIMLQALQSGLRTAGIPSSRMFREYFDWR